MVAMRSRLLFPELVRIEKTTGLPSLSLSAPFSRRKPSLCSAFNAASAEYDSGFSLALNQNLLAGETGPTAGCACPRNTTRARSSRLIASEIARRKAAERNQFFLYGGNGDFATSLNHICSLSSDGPASCTTCGDVVASLSKYSLSRVLIRSISPRLKRSISTSRLAWMSSLIESRWGSLCPCASVFQ